MYLGWQEYLPWIPILTREVTYLGWGVMSNCEQNVNLSKRGQVVKKMSSCQQGVKLSKRCQVVKKSNVWTKEEVHKK